MNLHADQTRAIQSLIAIFCTVNTSSHYDRLGVPYIYAAYALTGALLTELQPLFRRVLYVCCAYDVGCHIIL